MYDMSERLERIRAALAAEKLDGLLVSAPVDDMFGFHDENREYVSGFTGSTGYALITHEKAVFAADFRYVQQSERECAPNGFTIFPALKGKSEWFPKFVTAAGLAGRTIGVSAADMSLREFTAFQKLTADLPEGSRPTFVAAPPILETMRRKKDARELGLLQRAIDIADAAFESVAAQLTPEMTERQASTAFERAVLDNGGDGISFATIVAAGPWGAMPHARPRDEPLGRGRPVVFDCGARFQGYNSDLTRTIIIGDPDTRFWEIYGIVDEAQRAAIAGIRPGMTGVDAHLLAQEVIARYGYGDQFGHGLGHGVGLQVHEAPALALSSEDVLEEGMVFTIEPGIYLPGWGGVRIEDIVVLEHDGARALSHATKYAPAGAATT